MFDLFHGDLARWALEPDALAVVSPVPTLGAIEAVAPLLWQEHCLECHAPQCYLECSLFQARTDGNCRRLEYGFVPDSRFPGLLGYGVDCRFRRWAKIECKFDRRLYPLADLQAVDPFHCPRDVSGGCPILPPPMVELPKVASLVGTERGARDYSFLIECYSLEAHPFRLVMRINRTDQTLFRTSFRVVPGRNVFSIPFDAFQFEADPDGAWIQLFPENDCEARLVILLLDFVRITAGSRVTPEGAAKVKCLAWDLDNTLWQGVLVEQGVSELVPNEKLLAVVKELDRRGIIQTVVSKNNLDEALHALETFGVRDYFVYPTINWEPKSVNLRRVAECLNIGLDAIAFIDDSPFERAEVAAVLPAVRLYPAELGPALLALDEFDLPVTETSRIRRASYLAEMRREESQASAPGGYIAFLRSCDPVMEIYVPNTPDEHRRCTELLQRSSQLNLSSSRYSAEAYTARLADPTTTCYAATCRDRFGDYGTVAVVFVRGEECAEITDLAISCRIAKKRFEHALILWLGDRQRQTGSHSMATTLIKTPRNGPLAAVFSELPFREIENDDQHIRLTISLMMNHSTEGIYTIKFRDGR